MRMSALKEWVSWLRVNWSWSFLAVLRKGCARGQTELGGCVRDRMELAGHAEGRRRKEKRS